MCSETGQKTSVVLPGSDSNRRLQIRGLLLYMLDKEDKFTDVVQFDPEFWSDVCEKAKNDL